MSESKIYVVTSGLGSEYQIKAVFTNKESAETYCAIHNNAPNWISCYYYRIEEYETPHIDGIVNNIYMAVDVWFTPDGSPDIETHLTENIKEEKFENWNHKDYPKHLSFYTNKDTTKEELIKIAHDKYAGYMARESGI